MMPRRLEKVNSLLKNLAAEFLIREIGGGIIATVVCVQTSKDLKSAKIFISIFPENREAEALAVLEEKREELQRYVNSRIKIKFSPRLELEIDEGEKARKRIEDILSRA